MKRFNVPECQRRSGFFSRVVFAATVSLAVGVSPAQAQDLTIGAQFSLSGPAAAYAGPNVRAATEIAVEHVNATQMLGANRKLKLVLDDNGGQKAQAISLVTKQATSDQVLAIVGPQGSDLAVPAAPVANELQVPLLTLGGSAAIPQAGPWSFILLSPAEALVAESVKLAAGKLKVKSVGVVFDRTNDSSVRIKTAFEAGMKARGVKVVASEGVAPTDTNFGPLATKLVNTEMDALYVESPPSIIANVIIQAKQAGLDPKVKILASPNAGSPQFVKVGGDAVNGVYYPTAYLASVDTAENKRFVSSYRSRMGSDPDFLAAMSYNATMMMAEAIKVATPSGNRDKIREDRDKIRTALSNLRGVPSVMGAGRYSFKDRAGEFANVMVQLTAGKEVVVPLE